MFTLKVEVGRWHHVLQIQVGGAGQVRGGVKFGGSEVRGESAHEYLQANVFTITTLTN